MGNDDLMITPLGGVNDFNPRSRVGNDDWYMNVICSHLKFQSTFPRGERLMINSSAFGIDYFNPRSRVGNDVVFGENTFSSALFQSTFPRGERPVKDGIMKSNDQFQSTFPRGERLIYLMCR